MFGLGFSELLLIMVVVLIVFGPEKLPEIARNLGRFSGQLRRTMDEFKHEITVADFETRLQPPTERLGCESDRLTTTALTGEPPSQAAEPNSVQSIEAELSLQLPKEMPDPAAAAETSAPAAAEQPAASPKPNGNNG